MPKESWSRVTAAGAAGASTGEVIHYPPGTSKYNKVEYRLFCCITKHWQGKPLVDVQTVVNLIQSTTTGNRLHVVCMLDGNIYETGIKVTDESMDAIDIEYIGLHHGWSYIIKGFKLWAIIFLQLLSAGRKDCGLEIFNTNFNRNVIELAV